MTEFNSLDWIATGLVITGALNIGIIGLGLALGNSNPLTLWNPINILFGGFTDGLVESAFYILIGLAGIYEIYVGYKFAVSE